MYTEVADVNSCVHQEADKRLQQLDFKRKTAICSINTNDYSIYLFDIGNN